MRVSNHDLSALVNEEVVIRVKKREGNLRIYDVYTKVYLEGFDEVEIFTDQGNYLRKDLINISSVRRILAAEKKKKIKEKAFVLKFWLPDGRKGRTIQDASSALAAVARKESGQDIFILKKRKNQQYSI